MLYRIFLMCLLLAGFVSCSSSPIRRETAGDPAWNTLVDQYFNAYFGFYPSNATAAGLHEHDEELEDVTPAKRAARVDQLKTFLDQFEKVDASKLSPSLAVDRSLVIDSIHAELLDWEAVRSWEKNPDKYSSQITESAFGIMARTFAPPERRLESLIEREKLMPAFLESAHQNLNNPPHIFTDIALEQLDGDISFFQKDVPSAFTAVKNSSLQSRFEKSNQGVITALESYRTFLKELLPKSHGDFRLGAENFSKKLLYEEAVDMPLDKLLKVGYENLRANQAWYRHVARKLDPKAKPMAVLERLTHEHPTPDKLLSTVTDVLGGLKQFIRDHHVVTIPSDVMPLVRETPPFMRALTTASMDTPGPYETVAREAFYNITLPDPSWTKQEVEEHMEGFNYGTIISTSVHEAFPGHYIQFLWLSQAPSKVRKLLGCNSNAEGWAHYTEQMMLDEGYGASPTDPNAQLKTRLGQLQDALLRNARFIVGIKMHTGQMSFDQAVDFFVKEGYQSRTNALREVKRGTSDPTYLYYTLGKLEIMKLRHDYQKLKGKDFNIESFHNAFLAQGFPPIAYVRKLLLGADDKGPVL